MSVRQVYVFHETIRHRKTGETLVAAFAVRDDVKVIAAQVGRTKEQALDGFKPRVQKRCHSIIREDGDKSARYQIWYTEQPRLVKGLQLLLKALGPRWDYIRQGVLDSYDYTHKNVFLTEVDKAAERKRREAAENEPGSRV